MKCPQCSKELPDDTYRKDYDWYSVWHSGESGQILHRHNYKKPPKPRKEGPDTRPSLGAERLLKSLGLENPSVLMEMRAEAAVQGNAQGLAYFQEYEKPPERLEFRCPDCDAGEHSRMEARQLRDEAQRLLDQVGRLVESKEGSNVFAASKSPPGAHISQNAGRPLPEYKGFSWKERFEEVAEKRRRPRNRFGTVGVGSLKRKYPHGG